MNNLREFSTSTTGADAVTGERIFPGESVLDTNINNCVTPYMTDTLTRFVKESTIVWLAESAGYTLTRSNEGDPRDATSMDATNATNRTGTPKVGRLATRGSKAVK